MTDKLNNRANGFYGVRVTNWCQPPNGPPNEHELWPNVQSMNAKALPKTEDGKGRMEGIPNPWFTGPPNGNIIPFEEAENFKWREEIEEIVSHFQDTDNFSTERNQLLLLLSAIVLNPKIDIKVRKQACHAFVQHSNTRLLIEAVLCDCNECNSLHDAKKGFELVDKAFAAQ